MKKKLLFLAFLFMGIGLNAQQIRFSAGPANFKKQVACKISLAEPTDLTFKIFSNDKVVKTIIEKNAQSEPVFFDLSHFTPGKYMLVVFDKKGERLYEKTINKLNN